MSIFHPVKGLTNTQVRIDQLKCAIRACLIVDDGVKCQVQYTLPEISHSVIHLFLMSFPFYPVE